MNLRKLAIRSVALAALVGVVAVGCSNPPATTGTRPQGANQPAPIDKAQNKAAVPSP